MKEGDNRSCRRVSFEKLMTRAPFFSSSCVIIVAIFCTQPDVPKQFFSLSLNRRLRTVFTAICAGCEFRGK